MGAVKGQNLRPKLAQYLECIFAADGRVVGP